MTLDSAIPEIWLHSQKCKVGYVTLTTPLLGRFVIHRLGLDIAYLCTILMTKLFTKLMKRHIPPELLELLENWMSVSSTCVKWGDSWSCMFMVSSGVRQGSVLSPLLFAVYVDDIGKLHNSRVGKFVVLYADDILLLAPSVTVLHELEATDMSINVKKSCCMRIGPRHNKICSEISTVDGRNLAWVGEIRY